MTPRLVAPTRIRARHPASAWPVFRPGSGDSRRSCGHEHRPASRPHASGTAKNPPGWTRPCTRQTSRATTTREEKGARAARYAALGAVSALVLGLPAESGVFRCGGGGGEPVAAGLVSGQFGGAEGGELVQGVGDRAGRPGERLADLVRGEGGVGERAQVLLDQVAQCAGPGGRGAPAAGGGFDHPPPLGGLVPGGVQGGQGGVQVSGCEGLAGFVGRLGDGQDVRGGLGGDRRVRLLRGAGFRFPAFGGAAEGGGRGGLVGVWGAARAGGVGGRGVVGRGCRRGGGLPGVSDAGPRTPDIGRLFMQGMGGI